MAASTSDNITDVRNGARPVSTTVSSPRSSGGTTLSCAALTGWPTASKVHGVTYQIDSNSNPVSGTQIDFYGIVSGNSITSFTVADGTDNGNSIGDVVEMLPTAAWGQDLADALTSEHNRDGTHSDITPDGVTTDSVDTDTLVVNTGTTLPAGDIATADIANDAVTAAKMIYGTVRNRQGGTTGDDSWTTPGTSNTDTTAKNIFSQVGCVNSSASAGVTVTFPIAFSQKPVVFLTALTNDTGNVYGIAISTTTTNFSLTAIDAGNNRRAETFNWLAIGQ